MCLALPARVIEVDAGTDTARVVLGGVGKRVSTALLETVAVGEYLLVHVGFAIGKVSVEEAERTLALIAEAGILVDAGEGPAA